MLAAYERFIEIPGLAASVMVHARIASRDELKFFWQILQLEGRPNSGLAKLRQVAILIGQGYSIPPRNLARRFLSSPERLQTH